MECLPYVRSRIRSVTGPVASASSGDWFCLPFVSVSVRIITLHAPLSADVVPWRTTGCVMYHYADYPEPCNNQSHQYSVSVQCSICV